MVDRGTLLDRRVGLEGGKEGSREKGGGERGRGGGRGGEARKRERRRKRGQGERGRGGGRGGGRKRGRGDCEGAIPDKTRLRDYTFNEELTPGRCLELRWRC